MQEMKFVDTSRSGATLSVVGDATGGEVDPTTINTLCAPTTGAGQSNRIGKRITITAVHVTGVISIPAQTNQTTADTMGPVLVALVLDKQTNGAQLNSEDVYTNPTTSAVTNATPLRNMNFSKRFKVLQSLVINPKMATISFDGTNVEQTGEAIPFRIDKKLRLPIEFNSLDNGNVGDIVDNSLHIVAFSSSTSQGALMSYNARVRFEG